jgi:hypothetical protein
MKNLLLIVCVFCALEANSQELEGSWIVKEQLKEVNNLDFDTSFLSLNYIELERFNHAEDTMLSILKIEVNGHLEYCAETYFNCPKFYDNLGLVQNSNKDKCLSQYKIKKWEYYPKDSTLVFIFKKPTSKTSSLTEKQISSLEIKPKKNTYKVIIKNKNHFYLEKIE